MNRVADLGQPSMLSPELFSLDVEELVRRALDHKTASWPQFSSNGTGDSAITYPA